MKQMTHTDQVDYERALALLRQALGNSQAEFRDGQWQAIEQLVNDRARLLVVERTGWGKSLVYFLATRLLRDRGAGPTILVSPLLALMRNQLQAADRLGLRAATINSSNTAEWAAVRDELRAGTVDLLLISPERLANDEFRERDLLPIASRVGLFVVDEAHCISDWGHDFRPDYRRIVRVLQALPPGVPALAVTATANNRVVDDVVAQLGNLSVIRGPLARASLGLQNIELPTQSARMAWLAEQLPQLPGSGIVYTLTVRDADRVAGWLQEQGIDAQAYYGDVDNDRRQQLEQDLLNNRIKALIATPALGMGFDKPDLGFVVHFQRPGSAVHYYQQVGRAGRAIERAYGILLGGREDSEIVDYFIRTAMPPQAHVAEVLAALEAVPDGLSVAQIEARINLGRMQIEKVLKTLAVETPPPIVKQGTRWSRTPLPYEADDARAEHLLRIRRHEQERMQAYFESDSCLMVFLGRELDDPDPQPCGRCAPCNGGPLVPTEYSIALANAATAFLRGTEIQIQPRAQWPGDALAEQGFRGRIPAELRAETGRALSIWGDAGWGELVKQGRQFDGHFDEQLLGGAVELLERWRPEPAPTWVTCVPSPERPDLVPPFAEQLAAELGLPFVPCVRKIRRTEPQRYMNNSNQQARNLAGAFEVDAELIEPGPVLLIDDLVDSGWTLTVVSALLRQAGAEAVLPLVLAQLLGG